MKYSVRATSAGTAIFCNGTEMSSGQIIEKLAILEQLKSMIVEAPELNLLRYEYCSDLDLLNSAVIDMWKLLEKTNEV